jgi:sugar (pentulose or hexulose) kinase
VGLFESVPQAARRMVAVERVFRPDPGRRERYDRLLSLYRETYQALKPIYQRMNG